MFLALCLFRWQPSEFELKLRRASLGPMLACAVFVVYAQGDWMLFGRFVIPVWPVVALLTSVWLSSLMDHQSQISALRWRSNVSVLFLALALSMAATLAWLTPLTDYVTNHGLAAMLMRGHDQMTVGHWLTENANDGATLVTLRLGGISYGAPHIVVWDLGGLTNREEALYTRQASLYPIEPHPVFQRGPDIIAHIVYPVLGYEDTLDFSCWLLENYFFARSFAQGDYGSVDIWVSQQTSNKTLKHPFTPVDLPDNMVNEAQCE
jgi:hypothetical protein